MATITVHTPYEWVEQLLRVTTAANGRSMEQKEGVS